MILEINTEEKTIIIKRACSIQELLELITDWGIEDYSIMPESTLTISYPTATSY